MTPTLAIVRVGQDAASKVYVDTKIKTAKIIGIKALPFHFPETVSQEDMLAHLKLLNEDEGVHGIIVQLPLPKHLGKASILQAISPHKDVDGLHPLNLGKMLADYPPYLPPCTPKACMTLIKSVLSDLRGKHAVVVGRSTLVGKPVALLLLQEDCTVTICHSHTKDLAQQTLQANVIVCATGQPGTIIKDMVKPDAVIIDVGISRSSSEKGLLGDVETTAVQDVARAITPVPGGVGPMTVSTLMENVIRACEAQFHAG